MVVLGWFQWIFDVKAQAAARGESEVSLGRRLL
jgi:hypothetical protein